jgi:hypothetical protein
MKQIIKFAAKTPTATKNISVRAICKKNNKLHVLLKVYAGISTAAEGEVAYEHEIENGADQELPVVFYIVNERGTLAQFMHKANIFFDNSSAIPYMLLHDAQEFLSLMSDSTQLYKRQPKETDLAELVELSKHRKTMNPHMSEALIHTGIVDKNARVLLQRYPHAAPILIALKKAGVIKQNISEAKSIFARLMHGIIHHKLSDTQILDLLRIYNLLAGNEMSPCVLTKFIHKVICKNLIAELEYIQLDRIATILDKMLPLTQTMVDNIFSCPVHLVYALDVIDKIGDTKRCLHSLYDRKARPSDYYDLYCALRYLHDDQGYPKPWVDANAFVRMTADMSVSRHMIKAMKILNDLTLHDFHEALLNHIIDFSLVIALNEFNLLNENQLRAAQQQPELNTAFRFCYELASSNRYRQNAFNLTENLVSSLLSDFELVEHINQLNAIYAAEKKRIEATPTKADNCLIKLQTEFQHHCTQLIASTNHAREKSCCSLSNIVGLFTMQTPRNLLNAISNQYQAKCAMDYSH